MKVICFRYNIALNVMYSLFFNSYIIHMENISIYFYVDRLIQRKENFRKISIYRFTIVFRIRLRILTTETDEDFFNLIAVRVRRLSKVFKKYSRYFKTSIIVDYDILNSFSLPSCFRKFQKTHFSRFK